MAIFTNDVATFMTTATKASQRGSARSLLMGIWSHLSLRRRLQLALLVVMMLASGVAELVSLGAVMPFLAVLSDPEQLWKQSLVQVLASRIGFSKAIDLLLPATLMFASAAVLAAIIRLLNLRLNLRFAAAVGSDLSCEAYKRTLYQPYEVHLRQNSSAVINACTAQINITVASLNQFLMLTTSSVVAVGLIFGLLLIDAPVALATTSLFGCSYGVLAITGRRELRSNGKIITDASTQQLKALQEGLGGIRDVLLNSSQSLYMDVYRKADRPQRKLLAKNVFLASYPRYVLEALGMVAIALLGWLLVLQRGEGSAVIPLLGAMALGAQRLLPALQQIYKCWASLKSNNAAIKIVLAMLDQPLPPQITVGNPLQLYHQVTLEKVNFSYGLGQPEVLREVNLEIRRGERIGLIGTTGSGKSTTVDILMGLLAPTGGRMLVDGKDIYEAANPELLNAWRATIAHVPQFIYLADSSFAENIAFGVSKNLIDMDRVRAAASQAQITNYIESCSQGYECIVGERGIRLSGGQRQRIGIARALYKSAQVLILDEATSALDNNTEHFLMDSINALSCQLTIVIIAHRLSTVERCDRLFRIENGRLFSEGFQASSY